MAGDIAVVFDVAGTILRMYRVAKDLLRGCLIEKVITSDLIMEKEGRALVVPQLDPAEVISASPDQLVSTIFKEATIEVSCSSTPISREEATSIIRISRAKIKDIQEAYWAVVAICQGSYRTTGAIVDAGIMEISHSICTAGEPFPGLYGVLRDLEDIEADVYIASGDSRFSLLRLEDLGFARDRMYPAATPKHKREIVAGLQQHYGMVVMVGDGLNDLQALQAADLGVLTVQQRSHQAPCLYGAADKVIEDIQELPGLLSPYAG